jgi:UDP-glucose 4-epimerase
MKFLVTGGAGFIASHVVDRLINEGHQVVIIDDMSTGKESNLNPKAKLYKMDICDPALESVFQTEKPDYVNHHAGQISVVRSVREPDFDVKVNVLGSLNIIQLSHKYNVKKIVSISSGGTVYGEPKYLPVDEDHPNLPLSPYGIDKFTTEKYLYMYGVIFGMNYTILRYSNVYGPRQDPHGEAGVVAIFTLKMLDGIQPTIFGDGTATRDYIYVEDIVEANMLAFERGDREAYNIAVNKETSVNEIFSLLKAEFNFPHDVIYGDKRPGELQRICLTNHKAKAGLGWSPKVSLEEGIKRTVQYYKQ